MIAEFNKVVTGIKNLHIQGAENVAKEASKSLKCVVRNSKATKKDGLLSELNAAVKKLISTRPTEPAMRNALKYIFLNIKGENVTEISKEIYKKIDEITKHFEDSNRIIGAFGKKKIKNDFIVFTHCHSSTVVSLLIKAKKVGKNFEVHNTETRPLFQGRKTASELAKENIAVTHYIDSASMLAMKKADICLFGADAIQSDGRVINKIGTGLFTEIANKHDIPVFCCMNSWKFDPLTIWGDDERIENRPKKEVWATNTKNIEIENPAFEVIEPQKITGIISELGIYHPDVFSEIARRHYPWLLESID